MLYIHEGDKVPLDKKFHRQHNLCAIIYDQLTEIFSDENYSALNRTSFEFDKDTQIEIEKFQSGDIHALDWLKINGLNKEIAEVLTKHITMSVLSDYVNFIFESLSCAMRGKMTVAYALLRKPFTDELLIFEQLLDDSDDFIRKFFHDGDPSNYDPSNKKIDKHEIINSALEKSKPNIIYTPELIHDLRYGKSLGRGINGISNHALHIVTNDKNYKTTEQNLNFVFSTKEDVKDYWQNYYFFVPYLLIYSVSVIDNIVIKFLPSKENQHLFNVKTMVRFVAILFWNEWQDGNSSNNSKIFKVLTDNLKLHCEKCDLKVKVEKADFELFLESSIFLCPNCFNNLIDTPIAVQKLEKFVLMLKSMKKPKG